MPPGAMAAADAGEHERNDYGGRGHFLVVAYGLQGHLNPARALARRLARIHGGSAARVTLSVTVAAHGRMFPSLISSPDEEVSDGLISYAPYSDGFEFGATPRDADQLARSTRESARSLSALVHRFAAAGRPVTCIVSAFSLPAADVAVEHGIPLAVYWIQAAAALAVYYHYFHGYEQLVASHVADPSYEVTIPGLRRPLRIHEFPSFLVDASGREQGSVRWFRSLFEHIDREKPKILVNTPLHVLEATALEELKRNKLDVLAVGPTLPQQAGEVAEDRIHLYKNDQKRYMEWLETKPARSVVYMSYGSMLSYDRLQVQEILQGLLECGRPYLWVVRKEGRDEEVEQCLVDSGSSEQGLILEWCDQIEVLSHSSVGCFITHCGWNSTLEAMTLGVPMITVPSWSDQPLNAHLVEELGVGVRAGCSDTGLLVGSELAKCIEKVVGDNDKSKNVYCERADALKDKIRKEVLEGGLVELGLQDFIAEMQNPK